MTDVDELHERHSELVDKKFLEGLTGEEQEELDEVNEALDEAYHWLYEPIIRELKLALEKLKEDAP